MNQDWVVNRGTVSTLVAISASIFDKTLPWILWKKMETHKKFHYSSNRRKHQFLWLLVQDYKNNTDLLYNSHEMQIDQLLLGQSSLLFSQRIFLLMSKLSLSFLDSLPATLFLLELYTMHGPIFAFQYRPPRTLSEVNVQFH